MSENWKTATLSEFVKEFIVPQRDKPTTFGGEIPWCRIEDFEGPYLSASKSGKCVTTKSVAEMPLRVFPTNTVLVSCSANLGRCAITTRPLVTNQTFIGLVPKDDVDSKFLYYLMGSKSAVLNEMATGVTIRYLSREKFSNLIVSIPSLPEQQRIVRLLDKAFEGIAIAKANAEKNLRNARALFESYLQSIFTKGGTGWAERPLIDLCSVFEDGDWIESKDQSSGGIRLIQTGNVGKGVFKDRAGKARFVSESTFKTLRCTEIFAGDCLVSRLPDPVGRSCIIPSTTEKMITAVDCTILRFKKDVLIPAYFVYYSQSAHYLSSIAKLCTGTTRNRISRSNLGLTSVPVPPLAEQREIIEALIQIERQTQALEASYSKKLTVLEEFAKSLLREAFSGALEAA